MKTASEVVACVVDYGTFICVANRLAETMKTVYYYSPYEEEYQDVRECLEGVGIPNVRRIDSIFDPEVFDSIDLFVFPDTGYSSVQKYLRGIGKAVWGSMSAIELELYRDKFLDVMKKVDLPIIPYKRIVGVVQLREYLEDKNDKWIKINRFRRNMETWHYIDYINSKGMLDALQVIFGGAGDTAVFVVQDNLDSDMEVGYDGWCVNGNYPSRSFQGYEKKNELYLGSLLSDNLLPDAIKVVNKAMSPILEEYGYRCWWATEIRIKDKVPYFTDPTARMAGQTMEHQTETLANYAEVVWEGANGNLIEPIFKWPFAVEATLHYDSPHHDDTIDKEWKSVQFPKGIMKWVKLYHYFQNGDVYNFSPQGTDELGVVMGVGSSIPQAMAHLRDNLKILKDIPVHAETSGFSDLLRSIHRATEAGLYFADQVPPPEDVYEIMCGKESYNPRADPTPVSCQCDFCKLNRK